MADDPALESTLRTAWEAHDFEGSATLALEHYGPELLSYLISLSRNAAMGGDIFGQFSEDFWRSWPMFEWRCSVRTWSYTLARRAATQHHRRERKHERQPLPTQLSRLSQAVDRVRTATLAHQRTDVKDRFQELRAQLPEEDQTLLILRVDRGLSWLELAEIMFGDEAANPERRKTEAARLRKRFQLAKERLRAMVEQAGLLNTTEE